MSEVAVDATAAPREIVLVTGISGSGKSVALHALEDAGFFCVDNLPPELLREFIRLEQARSNRRIAVAVDARSAGSLPSLVPLIEELRGEGFAVTAVFLDASTDALVRRFSETRRPHPLSDPAAVEVNPSRRRSDRATDGRRALVDAIELERVLLGELREVSTVIDTSSLRPAQLRAWIGQLVGGMAGRLTLVFESFAFKHGVPLDADYVFDVRVLPNPYYIRELRPLTGRDADVAAYLDAQPEAIEMLAMIESFLRRWLPDFEEDQRSYLTVGIGCTGGQHRSVFLAEKLAARFADRGATLVRHRELDGRGVVMTGLPLFPLQTVLFPGGLLHLKVFEARYLDLIGECLRNSSSFGVIALKQGREVRADGEAIEFEAVGTLAELIDVDGAEAGILKVRCRGGERFTLDSRSQRGNGLWIADVTLREADPAVAPDPAMHDTVRGLANAIGALKTRGAMPFLEPYRFDDAAWVANRWCELLPISNAAKQKLMELPDGTTRLQLVDEFLRSKDVVQ